MFKNHLKVALRTILHNKTYTFINLLGLATGIAVCFLIFLWVADEIRYDRFHEDADRIYRTIWEARFGDNQWQIPLGPVPVAEALKTHFPEVEHVTRLRPERRTVRQGEEYMIEDRFLYVDESFFDVFSVNFLAGDPATALRAPEAVVLTEEMARKYFPDQSPIGQTLVLEDGTALWVTAVVERFPPQSHFHFDFLAPLQTLSIIAQRRNHWGSGTVYTYLKLKDGESAAQLQAKFADYVEKEIHGEVQETGNYNRFRLQPLTDIHLYSHLRYELAPNGNATYVTIFAIVGSFILILACINFINLATARSARRAREVGIRKVLGSQRGQLVRQFLSESLVYVVLAVALALFLAELSLPLFNGFTGKELTFAFFSSPQALLLLTGIAVVVAVLAGTYPAFLLSSFLPVHTLRRRVTAGAGGDTLRNILVVTQFCISIALIIGTLVVGKQLAYLQEKQLGFDKEHVLIVQGVRELGNRYTLLRDRLAAHPAVVTASAAQTLPGRPFDSTIFEPEQPANYETSSLTYAMIDEHFVEVLGLKLAAGRNFSHKFATDSSAFLINETAAKALGWREPVGKRMTMSGVIEGRVIGVVEDFHIESLHNEVKAVVFPFGRWQPAYLAVRLQAGKLAEGTAAVKAIWENMTPHPFRYSFLDRDVQQLYETEQRVRRIFTVFSSLAIVIACLGLFGLTAFTAEQRTKEIGIRKVLGASFAGVVGLLSKDFLRLVMIAFVIAVPIAYFAMLRWLEDFAYRVELSPEPFAVAGALAVLVALVTVSGQAIKAALANPVETLRYE